MAYEEILEVHRAGSLAGNWSADTLAVTDQMVGQPAAWIDLEPPDYPGQRGEEPNQPPATLSALAQRREDRALFQRRSDVGVRLHSLLRYPDQ